MEKNDYKNIRQVYTSFKMEQWKYLYSEAMAFFIVLYLTRKIMRAILNLIIHKSCHSRLPFFARITTLPPDFVEHKHKVMHLYNYMHYFGILFLSLCIYIVLVVWVLVHDLRFIDYRFGFISITMAIVTLYFMELYNDEDSRWSAITHHLIGAVSQALVIDMAETEYEFVICVVYTGYVLVESNVYISLSVHGMRKLGLLKISTEVITLRTSLHLQVVSILGNQIICFVYGIIHIDKYYIEEVVLYVIINLFFIIEQCYSVYRTSLALQSHSDLYCHERVILRMTYLVNILSICQGCKCCHYGQTSPSSHGDTLKITVQPPQIVIGK